MGWDGRYLVVHMAFVLRLLFVCMLDWMDDVVVGSSRVLKYLQLHPSWLGNFNRFLLKQQAATTRTMTT